MAKPKSRSRTLWLNGAMLAASVLFMLAADAEFLDLIGPIWARILCAVVAGLAAANIGLRFDTHQPIEGSRAAKRKARGELTFDPTVRRGRRS